MTIFPYDYVPYSLKNLQSKPRLGDIYDVPCTDRTEKVRGSAPRETRASIHNRATKVTGAFNEHTFDILKGAPIKRTKGRDNDLVDVQGEWPLVIVGMSTNA